MASKAPINHLCSPIRCSALNTPVLRCFAPSVSCRYASGLSLSKSTSKARDQPKKKKKQRSEFITQSLRDSLQFSLCDAMRYIRAFEVGRNPTSCKYDLAVRLRTAKNGPAVRNRLQLPHAVNTSLRICVICPPDSSAAAQAKKAGASLVGEETVFEAVKEGRIDFDRCICHVDSAQKLNKAALGRILGPKGLMPSSKTGTMTKDVAGSVKGLVGGTEYREKLGVIRCAVGQLGFTPEEMQQNVRTFINEIKKDLAVLSDRISKDIHEVVLSSTNAPGFSLNGDFRGPTTPPTRDLAVL